VRLLTTRRASRTTARQVRPTRKWSAALRYAEVRTSPLGLPASPSSYRRPDPFESRFTSSVRGERTYAQGRGPLTNSKRLGVVRQHGDNSPGWTGDYHSLHSYLDPISGHIPLALSVSEAERIAENVRVLNRAIEQRRQELTVIWPLARGGDHARHDATRARQLARRDRQ
jgi:hypothetical protein